MGPGLEPGFAGPGPNFESATYGAVIVLLESESAGTGLVSRVSGCQLGAAVMSQSQVYLKFKAANPSLGSWDLIGFGVYLECGTMG